MTGVRRSIPRIGGGSGWHSSVYTASGTKTFVKRRATARSGRRKEGKKRGWYQACPWTLSVRLVSGQFATLRRESICWGCLRNGDITTTFPEVFSTGYRLQQSEAPS